MDFFYIVPDDILKLSNQFTAFPNFTPHQIN